LIKRFTKINNCKTSGTTEGFCKVSKISDKAYEDTRNGSGWAIGLLVKWLRRGSG